MAYDLEEQEQLDEFRAWWKKNGKWLTNLVLAVVLGFAAWTAYQFIQNKKAVEASTLYQNLMTLEPTQTAEIKAQATKLMENFAGTPYAGRAAVYAAKINYQAKDSKSAKAQLDWAKSNATETAVKAIATLQLANLLVEEKNYDGANKLLANNLDAGYDGLKNNLQGDILLAQGKTTEAKKAFEKALEGMDNQGRLYQFTKQKLEALGS